MNFEQYLNETVGPQETLDESTIENLLGLGSLLTALYVHDSVSKTISFKARDVMKSIKNMYSKMIQNQKWNQLDRKIRILIDDDPEVVKLISNIKEKERGKKYESFKELIDYLSTKLPEEDIKLIKNVTREKTDY